MEFERILNLYNFAIEQRNKADEELKKLLWDSYADGIHDTLCELGIKIIGINEEFEK